MSYWNAVATVATGAVDELHLAHAEHGQVLEVACNHPRDDWTIATASTIETTDVCLGCPRQQWTSVPGVTGIDHVHGRLEIDAHGYDREVVDVDARPRQDARTDGGQQVGDFYRSDGRRSEVECQGCGESDGLLLALDPVDHTLFVGCPNCQEDIVRADVLFADVELTFTTGDLDRIDPALRDDIKEALNHE